MGRSARQDGEGLVIWPNSDFGGVTILRWEGGPINPPIRFSVAQADKNSSREDLRHARTNRALDVLAPIDLVTWDHVSEIANRFPDMWPLCDFVKCDHKSAHKALPVAPAETPLEVSALKSPADRKFYAFASMTLLLGSIASAPRYNIYLLVLPMSSLPGFLEYR